VSEEIDVYETFAKVRDCLHGAAMALDELVQKKSKVVLKEYDPEKIKWEDKTGPKGPFQSTDDANNLEYKALRGDLAKHDGKLNVKGKFYWVFQNGTTIGRKPARAR
jgi:hypothetical protein